MRLYLVSRVVLRVGLFGALAAAASATAVRPPDLALLAENCASCHQPTVHPIGHLSERELLRSLLRLKSGEKYSTIMGRILTPFGEQEIKELVEHLSGTPKVMGGG